MLRAAGSLMALGLLLAGCSSTPAGAGAPPTPNIVVILADDMGMGDLGAYNRESKIPTPNIDRIAREGMRFTDMHTPSAVCTPTRYGLLTGRYCWRTRLKQGVLWGSSPSLIAPGRMTIASMLKPGGYHTGCIGKWHLGLQNGEKTDYTKPLTPGPNAFGFDYFFGIPASLDMEPYVYVRNDQVLKQPNETIARSKHRRQGGGGYWRAGPIAAGFRHIDVLPEIARESVDYLNRRAKEPSTPFFLYVPFTAPHTPWVPTPEFQGRTKIGHYGDFVAQVDHVIGRIERTLDRLGFSENTLLVVTSDNGSHWPVSDIRKWGHRANHVYRGQKADIHEGGHRVPFLVRWPGRIRPGGRSAQTACLTDLLATFAEVVGFRLPDDAGEDSFSLLPILEGRSDRIARPYTIHHALRGLFAIREGDWKLIDGQGSGGFTRVPVKKDDPKGQLYNLADDPTEKKNLYDSRPEVVGRLAKLLEQCKQRGRSR